MLCLFYLYHNECWRTFPSSESKELSLPDADFLARVGASFVAEGFDWKELRCQQLHFRCQSAKKPMICGKLLAHCKEQVTSLRERIGVRLCVFKVGITSNPPQRFASYVQKNYCCMWLIAQTESVDKIHMLEAAVISHFQQHVGCRNEPNTGGEGALNRTNRPPPPYFLYVTAARADKVPWVG